MAPFYRNYDPNFQLHIDDITGIQALYGPSNADGKHTQSTLIVPNPISDPIDYQTFCTDAKFDAITEVMFNSKLYTFAFYQDLYAQLDENGIVENYPKKISEGWPGLKNNLDAAFYQPATYTYEKLADSKMERVLSSPPITYFFKGSKFWKNQDGKFLDGYPREISSEWKGVPGDIDAAFTWSRNGKVYIVKGLYN
jgi:matrix metalloproteinase-14 (membrane-inserted)